MGPYSKSAYGVKPGLYAYIDIPLHGLEAVLFDKVVHQLSSQTLSLGDMFEVTDVQSETYVFVKFVDGREGDIMVHHFKEPYMVWMG